MSATAISINMLDGNEYLWCKEEGYSSESLIKLLQEQLGDEVTWIERVRVEAVGWDKSTLNMQEVYDEIYKETHV